MASGSRLSSPATESTMVMTCPLGRLSRLLTFNGVEVALLAAEGQRAEQGERSDGDEGHGDGGGDSGAAESGVRDGALDGAAIDRSFRKVCREK